MCTCTLLFRLSDCSNPELVILVSLKAATGSNGEEVDVWGSSGSFDGAIVRRREAFSGVELDEWGNRLLVISWILDSEPPLTEVANKHSVPTFNFFTTRTWFPIWCAGDNSRVRFVRYTRSAFVASRVDLVFSMTFSFLAFISVASCDFPDCRDPWTSGSIISSSEGE